MKLLKTKAPLVLDTRFGGEAPAILYATRYAVTNAIAPQLVSNDGIGEPLATATVNVPGASIPRGCVLVKNWSENEGMDHWLVDNGIALTPISGIPCGFAIAEVMPLTPEILAQIETEMH